MVHRFRACQSSGLIAALVLVAVAVVPPPAWGCSTAVASALATADGRPILWKNRDAEDKRNQVVFDSTGRHAFVGVVNGGDMAGLEIWAGLNAAGFAIMNSASYNLEEVESVAEGSFMRLALQSCTTVADFQALLERTDAGGRDVTANFGVIDAQGGAAIFETGRHQFKRFDADDAANAPRGLLVRTNFSDTGNADSGSGMLRRQRAYLLLDELVAARRLDAATLLARVARDVANPFIASDPMSQAAPRYAYTGDSVCRFDTASAAVFVGVKPGEDPLLATAWVVVGQPVTGVAAPIWVRAGSVPAELAAAATASRMTAAFDEVRARFYPQTRGEMKKYIDAAALRDPVSSPLPRLAAAEKRNLARAAVALRSWATTAPTSAEVAALQEEIARDTVAAVRASLAPGAPHPAETPTPR